MPQVGTERSGFAPCSLPPAALCPAEMFPAGDRDQEQLPGPRGRMVALWGDSTHRRCSHRFPPVASSHGPTSPTPAHCQPYSQARAWPHPSPACKLPASCCRADVEHQSVCHQPGEPRGPLVTRVPPSHHKDMAPGPTPGCPVQAAGSSSITPPVSAGSRSPPCLPPGTHSLGIPSACRAGGYFGVRAGPGGALSPGTGRGSRVPRFTPLC